MIETIADVFELIGRNPEELIGVAETEFLDFKVAPHKLDSSDASLRDRECFELAKDVSAFANARGGVIVIGVETRRAPQQNLDVAIRLRPVGPGVVNPQQIVAVVHQWVFPRLDVRVKAHTVAAEGGDLWTILVEPQPDRSRPFIVIGEFLSAGGANRSLFAVYKRAGPDCIPYQPTEVQQWIHRGWRASLEASPPLESTEPASPDEVLREDLSALGLAAGAAYYYVQCRVHPLTRMERFYRGGEGSLFDRLQQLEHLRRSGFNLPDVVPPALTERSALRVTWVGEDSLSVLSEGLATAVQGQNHLTWASDRFAPTGQAWINPTALTEFTLEFFRVFFAEVVSRTTPAVSVQWRVGMRGLAGEPPVFLPERPYGRGDLPLDIRPKAFPASRPDFDVAWQSAAPSSTPGETAYAALTLVYGQFGLSESLIPYRADGAISEEVIRTIR